MASSNWYFTKEQLESSPSRQFGIDGNKELSYRQQAANFIQEMGQKLKVSQLCINTAIVYMHRFYVFHTFVRYPWNTIAAAALLLAAKVEEQPRKLEHVIRVVNLCKNPNDKTFDTTSEKYLYQLQDLIFNENILLQTLGFEVAIDHPHTHVVRCCHLVRATKDLAHTSYFMASNSEWKLLEHDVYKLPPDKSEHAKKAFLFAYKVATKSLHLTTMCLQYKPTVVACFCIHFVCKWANWEIPLSNEKKQWFSYVDETVTSEILEQLTNDFLAIYENCPSRLKEKIVALGEGLAMPQNTGSSASPFDSDRKPVTFTPSDPKDSHLHKIHYSEMKTFTADEFRHRALLKQAHAAEASSSGPHHDRERDFREKKEREHGGHHFKPPLPNTPVPNKHGQASSQGHTASTDPKLDKVARPPSVSSSSASGHGSHSKSDVRERKESNNSQQLVDKRDYNIHHKPSTSDLNNLNHRSSSSDKLNPSNKPRLPSDPKLQSRHRDELKPYNHKLESDIKKHLNAALNDKSLNSTSQKNALEVSKSVPVTTIVKQEIHNNNGSTVNPLIVDKDITIKLEHPIKEEIITVPPIIKRPSLFSPEKTPPTFKRSRTKTPPSSSKKSLESDFSLGGTKRSRTSSTTSTNSTNSEPELRPVMKKIDQVEGFESLMHDSSIGINISQQIADIVSPLSQPDTKTTIPNISIAKELKPPDLIPPFSSNISQPIINGIETTPTLISSLLKEAPTIPHLPVVTTITNESKDKEYYRQHKKSKKEKHKHRSKEKYREEKEKKRKHKDKDREKHRHRHQHKGSSELKTTPIKITIPKDKIQNSQSPQPTLGLKIKIPKDRIKTDTIVESSSSLLSTTTSGGSLKIKISKDVINNFNSNSGVTNRKRDRSKESPMMTAGAPPHKVYKSNHNRHSETRNSKNTFNQVSNFNSMYTPQMNVAPQLQQLHQQQQPPMYPPPSQNYFYSSYPPPNMQFAVPPPPPPYMYQQYYMYPPAPTNTYSNNTESQPPLPHEPPPNNPPPPPPDA